MNLKSFRHPVMSYEKMKIAESNYLALFIKMYYKNDKEIFLTENMSKLLSIVWLKIVYFNHTFEGKKILSYFLNHHI